MILGGTMADTNTSPAPLVAIIMGSNSDWPTMGHAAEVLDKLGVAYEARIVSAHRTPDRMFDFAKGAKAAGFQVIIAGAGGAAHLPGMVASLTPLPVFGVPVESRALAVDRADARRHTRGNPGDRQGRRHERGPAGCRGPCAER